MKKIIYQHKKIIIIILFILLFPMIPFKDLYMSYNIRNIPINENIYLEDINKSRTMLNKRPVDSNQISVSVHYAGDNFYLHKVKVDNQVEGLFITIAIPSNKDKPILLERFRFQYHTFYVNDFDKFQHLVPN